MSSYIPNNINANFIHRVPRRYNLGDYGADSPIVSQPVKYPLLAWWKADSLSLPNLTIMTGSITWTSSEGRGYVASIASAGPKYQISSSVFSQSLVVFSGGQSFNIAPAIDLSTIVFTMAVVCYSSGDGMIFGNNGANIQFRKFRSGVNNLSTYNGAVEWTSSNFSTTAGHPVVCWYQRDSGSFAQFYENATNRGIAGHSEGGFSSTLNKMGVSNSGGNFNGGIAEIIIWNYSFAQTDISNMYNNYFKLKYPGMFAG